MNGRHRELANRVEHEQLIKRFNADELNGHLRRLLYDGATPHRKGEGKG